MDDYRQIAKNKGVLMRISKPQVVAKSGALAKAPLPASRQQLIDEIVWVFGNLRGHTDRGVANKICQIGIR